MPSKKQTEARVGTFNFSADHGDKFYLQRAHEETEKDGAAEEKRDTETKREEPFQDDRRFYLVILTNLVVTTIVQCQEKLNGTFPRHSSCFHIKNGCLTD